ncbi:MAG: plasmid recombination protein, partial [Oscillospiraceae bacterium]|nr:plasmid recombination protein [Oscillospiraceae bacterium]
MSKLSISFTLGKASAGKANIEHNNREFVSSNVDVTRMADNVTYIRQDIREAYEELFGDALEEYNAKQTRKDRKIHDYFQHIAEDKRRETHYEIVVQFGDSYNTAVGSENGKLAVKMLDKYMRKFQARNPRLHIVNSVLHADESSPHLHIDFIPYYTQGKEKGLSQGVSLRAALEEQGFTNQNKKLNGMVAWENSEMKALENILNNHEVERDVKGAKHKNMPVPEYKASKDWKKLPKRKKNMSTLEVLENDLRVTREQKSLLEVENNKLTTERNSPWKCFYFNDPDKQLFVINKLECLNIPYRESSTGFEAQQCHVEKIRSIEKQYKAEPINHRDRLRDKLDRIIMQVDNYDKIFDGLKHYGYEIKHGKYTSVRPKNSDRFIRIKSLGESYNEYALRNRINARNDYENRVTDNLKSMLDEGKKDTIEYRWQYVVYQYVMTFKGGKLPARKTNPKVPFTFINDMELDRLVALNKKINDGVSIQSLRNDLANSERTITQMENRIDSLINPAGFDKDLFKVAERWYDVPSHRRNQDDVYILERYEYTSEKYYGYKKAIADNEIEVAKIEKSIYDEREKI